MLDKINRRKLVVGLSISVVLISAVVMVDFQKTTALQVPSRVDAVQYTLSTPVRVIVIHPNEEKVVPLKLLAPPQIALQLKSGVTVFGNEGLFAHTGKANLPVGISATLDKQSFNLPPISSSSQAPIVRDTTNMTISASQDVQVGKYTLAAELINGNSDSSVYIVVEVQK